MPSVLENILKDKLLEVSVLKKITLYLQKIIRISHA